MSKFEKVLARVLSGEADANIPFEDLRWLLLRLGFSERISGSHHIYTRADLPRRINLQPQRDGKAKEYQVDQTRTTLNIVLQKSEES